MPAPTTTTRRPAHNARRARGAAMIETVLILPFVMVVIVLIIYLGWNFRRMAQVTNMDRYVVWERTTPGSPGPDRQFNTEADRNPRLNEAFFGLNGDLATSLTWRNNNQHYTPIGHLTLRNRQADETYAYFEDFIDNNPRAIHERFDAVHSHFSDKLREMGMSERARNAPGHSRMNGDWRYVNGITYNGGRSRWQAAHRRVSPGESLRDVFFAELDDGLTPYVDDGNRLARAIRDFYYRYPSYRGPWLSDGLDEDQSNNGQDEDRDGVLEQGR